MQIALVTGAGAGPLVASPLMPKARRGGRGSRRTWPQRFLITFNVMAIVACVSMAAGLAYFQYKFQQ
ncbi:hypothetical protein B7486_58265, partial [cyanobacterium TDX16]